MSEDNLTSVDCTDGTEVSAQEPIIQLTEHGVEGFDILCRLCANRSDHLIPIYSEEGVTNDLADKMNLYLPIKVSKTDLLPLQCCFQCASTVLTWHELVVASVEADRRLREVQTEVEKQFTEQETENPGPSQIDNMNTDRLFDTRPVSLNPFRQENQLDAESESADVSNRKKPNQTTRKLQRSNIKLETNSDLTTDGDWIKTELILESEDVDPLIADCELIEDQDTKLNVNASDTSDFDDLDPEYEPTDTKLLKTEFVSVPSLSNPDTRKFKREYHCDFCPTVAGKKDDLKKHIKDEHPDKYDAVFEKRQRKRSKIDQDAVNRAKIVVDSRTYYHCNLCGKNLHSPYTYIWHNRIHTGERPFVCDLCGKQFRVSQGLVRHLRETHAGIKNFPCDLCGRMFATRRNVEEHRRIHTNERPYICDLCGKAFKQKASLFVHNRSHTDSFPFKCNYCNQAFRTRPPLLVHVTRHTGEKPYPCDICGRNFRIKYELKRHQLIHSDDKPFTCAECGLSFRQKRYLRNHNKINHNRSTP